MSKFYEALKTILHDFEKFLTTTLKDERLSKSAAAEKENILKKIKGIQEEFPQLSFEGPDDAEASPKLPSRQPPAEPNEAKKKVNNAADVQDQADQEQQEIYSAIGDEAEQESVKPPSSTSSAPELAAVYVTAAEISAKCSKKGLLVKKSANFDLKSLLMRSKKFCVLNGGAFYMFDKQSSKKQCGSFPLRGYEARQSSDQSSKKEFSFEIINPGQKSYLFAASSSEEMQQWISAINSEALKAPDQRSSLVCETNGKDDSSSDGEDYEEPDDTSVQSKGAPASRMPVVSPPADDDEELYDDVEAARIPDDDQELYNDVAAVSHAEGDEDDLIYESFDEVSTPAAPVQPTRVIPIVPSPQVKVPDRAKPQVKQQPNPPSGDEDNYENMFYGKWNCPADSDNELAFKYGDIILVVSREYEHFGWWVGKLDGSVGLVPCDYLTPAYELISC